MSKKMRQIRISIIAIFSFVTFQTNAQTVNFFKENVYNLNYNPASEINVRQYFGIGVSNLNFQVGTNIAAYDDIVHANADGSKEIDPKGLFKRIKKNDYGEVFANMNMEVLGFGMRYNSKLYFTFSSHFVFENTLFMPRGLFQIATDGNMAHIGEAMIITPQLSTLLYLDNSLGFQYKINDRITIGLRGKYLLGVLGANLKEGFTLTTDDDWNLHLKGSALLNVYLPDELINTASNSDNGKYFIGDMGKLFSLGNFDLRTMLGSLNNSRGGGFDVGIDVKIIKKLGIKASLIDMGWIKWNRNQSGNIAYRADLNPNHPLYKNGELVFDGIANSEISYLSMGEWLNGISLDKIKFDSVFVISEVADEQTYVTMTNPKVFMECYYELSKIHKFSAMVRMDFIHERVLTTYTLGYNLNIKKVLDIAVCYSMSKGSYGNLGVGLSFNPGNVFHFYVAADNLPTVLSPFKTTPNLNIHTGIYFSIPDKKTKKVKKVKEIEEVKEEKKE